MHKNKIDYIIYRWLWIITNKLTRYFGKTLILIINKYDLNGG
jgi:hypothetical protein